MPETTGWFVYVLRCRGDRLYCGISRDVMARFAEHQAGKGAKFTRAFRPEQVVAVIAVAGHREALREERAFKALRRAQKLEQIAAWDAPANRGQSATDRTARHEGDAHC